METSELYAVQASRQNATEKEPSMKESAAARGKAVLLDVLALGW